MCVEKYETCSKCGRYYIPYYLHNAKQRLICKGCLWKEEGVYEAKTKEISKKFEELKRKGEIKWN